MIRTSSPFDLMHLGFETARLGMEAQSVIGLRTLGMAGLWNTPFDENHRMVAEKQDAFMKAGREAIEDMVSGQDPVATARRAVATFDETTSENRQRLSACGPRG